MIDPKLESVLTQICIESIHIRNDLNTFMSRVASLINVGGMPTKPPSIESIINIIQSMTTDAFFFRDRETLLVKDIMGLTLPEFPRIALQRPLNGKSKTTDTKHRKADERVISLFCNTISFFNVAGAIDSDTRTLEITPNITMTFDVSNIIYGGRETVFSQDTRLPGHLSERRRWPSRPHTYFPLGMFLTYKQTAELLRKEFNIPFVGETTADLRRTLYSIIKRHIRDYKEDHNTDSVLQRIRREFDRLSRSAFADGYLSSKRYSSYLSDSRRISASPTHWHVFYKLAMNPNLSMGELTLDEKHIVLELE